MNKHTQSGTVADLVGCLISLLLLIVVVPALIWGWAWLFMLLWNATAHAIFHLSALTHFQAFLVWMLLSLVASIFKTSVSRK